jgi:hypothetical protein
MKWILVFQLLLTFQAHSAFKIPSGLEISDAKIIIDRFAVGFVTKNPGYQFSQDRLDAFATVSTSYLETDDIADLGDGDSRSPLQAQSFHFGLQIPFNVELGLETSLISDQNRIQQFGGFARWSFAQWNDLRFYALTHGSSVNFKSLLGVNLYGTQLAASYNLSRFQLYAATGDLRVTSTFQPQLFSSGGSVNYRLGRRYSHQVFRISYELDRWTLSAQSDWIKKFHNTILISYRL